MGKHIHRTLKRLGVEDAVGQLRQGIGTMARLGTENGDLKLDWVEGVAHLLTDDDQLESVERDAQALWERGIRHILWTGMGGSVITVRVMAELGFCDGHNGEHMAIYPVDSTDPAALNSIVRQIAASKGMALPNPDLPVPSDWIRALLADVMMIGVSMGMTSEEPITHLTWFNALLAQAELPAAQHILVMTLPDSYLDQFAQKHHAPRWPLQLDGRSGTGGRMSAPTTRVFLLPAALYLTRLTNATGQLRALLKQAWTDYNLDLATLHPEQHPFAQIAAMLAEKSQDGACRLMLSFPPGWEALIPWIEQLMEESLGKRQKGIVIFSDQLLNAQAPCYRKEAMLRVSLITQPSAERTDGYVLTHPSLASQHALQRLAALATQFLGWQLCMALYGYVQNIPFAGQPAVENYKTRARLLRTQENPLAVLSTWSSSSANGPCVLYAPSNTAIQASAAATFAHTIAQAANENKPLSYFDLTFNGELSTELSQILASYARTLGHETLGVPVKVRLAPACYHSTEQGEMDGQPSLISLRILFRQHERCLLGHYDDTFLLAQAVSTWQAMLEQGRPCFLLVVDGDMREATTTLRRFFGNVMTLLYKGVQL